MPECDPFGTPRPTVRARSATIDEFPEFRAPNHERIEKHALNGPRPPRRRPALVSRNFIRNDLKRRTGARVAPAALDVVQEHLESCYAALVVPAVEAYHAEARIRVSRDANSHQLTFRRHHLAMPDQTRPESGGGGES